MSISGPSTRIAHAQLPHLAPIVMQVAARLSANLGAPDEE